ncbi:MAG: carboxypeptidase regulatory-like domain-containing protein [Myxococcales bacterium]|nr:carboxypeptidase regulatory-like domain-containing protein [Myxococcales bacterium]
MWSLAFRVALLSIATASAAHAATISGKITQGGSAGISGMEVRLWSQNPKGYVIAQTVTSNSSGDYSFSNVAVGTYKVDARVPKGTTANWGDRWYDKAAPSGSGYVAADADEITVANASDTITSIDIQLEATGGLDTSVGNASQLFSGVRVRIEQKSKPEIHHNDQAQAAPQMGQVFFRGLPPGAYRLIFHHPNASYETLVVPGPFNVSGTNVANAAKAVMVAMTADPNEPNNAPSDAKSAINGQLFRSSPPGMYTSTGALIGPRSQGDTDWYCFDAKKGDRYLVAVEAPLLVEGNVREDPWVDPIVAWYSLPESGAPKRVLTDDDGGPGARDALLDTKPLDSDGRYCAVVSMYGDTTWSGQTQMSAGRYQLTIRMGNRPPVVAGSYTTTTNPTKTPLPVKPATITVDEGQSVLITVEHTDPDGDALNISASNKDKNGADVTNGTLTKGAASSRYEWTPGPTAGKDSPYDVVITVKDAEFAVDVPVTITVNAVNQPPSVPTDLQPPTPTSTVSASATPDLSWKNSTDPDGDALTYDVEAYYHTVGTQPNQQTNQTESASGRTSYTLATVPENTIVLWRVRANDGQTTSPWSEFAKFVVSSSNDPPTAPELLKPTDGETVMTVSPTLSVNNPKDPDEVGQLELYFEVSEDSSFTNIVAKNTAPVLASLTGTTTPWTVDVSLARGSSYYARAYAKDSQGAQSGYSNVNKFTVGINAAASDAGPIGGGDGGASSGDGDGGGGGGGESGGCGCQTAPTARGVSLAWLVLFALGLLWRRQRRGARKQ